MDSTQKLDNVCTGKQIQCKSWIQRVSTTRSELHKIKKQAGDDSRDAAGEGGVWKEGKIRGRVGGGGSD